MGRRRELAGKERQSRTDRQNERGRGSSCGGRSCNAPWEFGIIPGIYGQWLLGRRLDKVKTAEGKS